MDAWPSISLTTLGFMPWASSRVVVTHLVETKLAQLSRVEAPVLSLTSFHGRDCFPGSLPLGDRVARIAAIEAVIGLYIELILISTFSNRFSTKRHSEWPC